MSKSQSKPRYVVSVRSVGCVKTYPYVQAGLYKSRPRKKDGVETYRLVRNIGKKRRSYRKAYEDAVNYARQHHIALNCIVRHGSEKYRQILQAQ